MCAALSSTLQTRPFGTLRLRGAWFEPENQSPLGASAQHNTARRPIRPPAGNPKAWSRNKSSSASYDPSEKIPSDRVNKHVSRRSTQAAAPEDFSASPARVVIKRMMIQSWVASGLYPGVAELDQFGQAPAVLDGGFDGKNVRWVFGRPVILGKSVREFDISAMPSDTIAVKITYNDIIRKMTIPCSPSSSWQILSGTIKTRFEIRHTSSIGL
ncbi:hypothetical protein PCANC_10636 [Puccinia coronata f. sp. avenae]|uniref:Uncharacterized protein n=1 Tax=Puccinia coronata f. sp. avenae TaxID=200324 RepID=A0A2N5V454_9BASI|nr:hypothetical protein PCANC_10636 [Puccinia coronata f. sp. avenae]